MNKTVLALTTAVLLAGGAATTASAQTTYYYYDNGVAYVNNDVDNDGVPNQYDRFDNRYPRTQARVGVAVDRDCNGELDAPDTRDVHDADCDGIPDRFDSQFGQEYSAQRHNPPLYVESGYQPPVRQVVRYNVGSYLPVGYYGDPYYLDYAEYNLTPPPYGYRWNRVGNDVYLVSTDNGLVAEVIYDYFH